MAERRAMAMKVNRLGLEDGRGGSSEATRAGGGTEGGSGVSTEGSKRGTGGGRGREGSTGYPPPGRVGPRSGLPIGPGETLRETMIESRGKSRGGL